MKVTTQAELDAALAAGESLITIESPRGVWLQISASDSATVWAYDSATVQAYDSATVQASDSATVQAYGSATVWAYDSATVRASDSATVEAYDSATVRASGSATVEAYDSATVRASGSATVRASGSATVRAYDSATVRASGSATVRAYDSATVWASDSATVRAYDSATVRAGAYVAVHLHSKAVTLDGGVVIDLTAIDLHNAATWLDYHGVTVTDGRATVYKAVDADLNTGHRYRGQGLHFGYTPSGAEQYYTGAQPGPRFLECTVAVADLIALGDKCKAPSCVVVREVDRFARPVEATAEETA